MKKNIWIIILIVVVILFSYIGYNYFKARKNTETLYAQAESAFVKGDYQKASELYSQLNSRYKDTAEKLQNARYYPRPVIQVNSLSATGYEYEKMAYYVETFNTGMGLADEKSEEKLNDYFVEQLLAKEFAQKNDISVLDSDVAAIYNSTVEKSGGESEFKKALKDIYQMEEADFKEILAKQILQQKVKAAFSSETEYKNYMAEAKRTAQIKIDVWK